MLAYILLYDFGYSWPWTYGHLYLALVFAALTWFARKRLPGWILAFFGAIAVWGLAGFLIVQLEFRFNLPQLLPTEQFLSDLSRRPAPVKVLDIGSGSGRTTIMVALARPGVRITALDNFSARYIRDNGPERLKANLRAGGVDESRVEIVSADMRAIPLPDRSFDGVVSSFAIDHVDRQGIESTLHEVSRVLKPDGEFLLSIIAADGWLKTVYGPLLVAHMRRTDAHFWPDKLRDAGLVVVQEGRQPGAKWYLCRKPPVTAAGLR